MVSHEWPVFHRAGRVRGAERPWTVIYRRDMNAGDATKILLDESAMPTQWYNVIADLPAPPPPPLHPGTREPVGPADLAPLFPMALIEQEVTAERYVDIPGGVLDVSVLPARTNRTRRSRRPTTTIERASAS